MSGTVRLRLGAGLAVVTAVLLAVATVGAVRLQPDRRSAGAEVPAPAGSSSSSDLLGAEAVPPVPAPAAGSDTPPTVPEADATAPGAAPGGAEAAVLPLNPPVPPPGPGPALGPPPVPAPPVGLPPLVVAPPTFQSPPPQAFTGTG